MWHFYCTNDSVVIRLIMECCFKRPMWIDPLKDIWTACDQPVSNSLDARKFAVAVRLVQLAQHSIPLPITTTAGADLSQGWPPDLRPAFFEGIAPPNMIPKPPTTAAAVPPPQSQQPPLPHAHVPAAVGGPLAPTSGGMSVSGGASVASSTHPPQLQHQPNAPQQQQLAMQDPYILTPSDQFRYDQMFPEYTSPSDPNFLYGPEAVALFQKSGLPREVLSQIWTMVDSEPIDNRLDKLEFALAMHLIICVSVKRLSLPATLPPSLAHWKRVQRQEQEAAAAAATSHQSAPQQNGNRQPTMDPSVVSIPEPSAMPPHMGYGGGGMSAAQAGFGVLPSPAAAPKSMPSPMRAAGPTPTVSSMGGGGGMSMPSGPAPPLSGLQGPPPLTQQLGGVSISDAFEGLGGGAGDTGSISSYRATTPVLAPSNGFGVSAAPTTGAGMPSLNLAAADHDEEPAEKSAPPPAPTMVTSAQLASSYDMGESSEELTKLRNALQKLQAENISLKAKMGSLTDEERDIQKELNATVAEVSNLANELTKTRAQVLASKSRLLESTAELKAAKEKKRYVWHCKDATARRKI
jgi:Cytoskeletal-regulatory complex EF hand